MTGFCELLTSLSFSPEEEQQKLPLIHSLPPLSSLFSPSSGYTRAESPLRQTIWYSSVGLGGMIGALMAGPYQSSYLGIWKHARKLTSLLSSLLQLDSNAILSWNLDHV